MGSVCAYLDRDRQRELPTYAYLPCPLGWGENRKKAGPHGGFAGEHDGESFGPAGVLLDDQPVGIGGDGNERFEDDAVFSFRTAAMLLGAPLQSLDNVLWNVSDQ